MHISLIFCIFAYTGNHFMEDQEREYLKENIHRLDRWENTPAAPSGRCSDLTEVEKEKLIDLLFARLENDRVSHVRLEDEIKRMADELQRANEASARWEQRTISAEKRADAAEKRAWEAEKKAESYRTAMQDKIDILLSRVEQLRNGDELRAMTARAEKAEKTVADLLASGRRIRVTTKATTETLANNQH